MPHKERTIVYEKLLRYPGMFERDQLIWDRFIDKNPKRFFNVTYDVLVGKPGEIELDVHPRVEAAWVDLTRWRIDVVAEDADAVYVIEVKPNANAKAIGQALSYAVLLGKAEQFQKPLRAVVLTDACSPITEEVAKLQNVLIWKA